MEPNDYRGKARVQTVNELPSLTVQADLQKADINHVLKKYKELGIVDHLAQVDAIFMDVDEHDDFVGIMQTAKTAEYHFMQLPPELRNVFNGDAAEWLAASEDPSRIENYRTGLERLGLLDPLPEPAGTPEPPRGPEPNNPSPEV